jgi:uncharacterized damage-inducible protein DinB
MSEVKNILKLLNKTFEKNAWHGPTVLEVIAQVKTENTPKRLPNTHSIIELVNHMTSWRIFTVKKILGDAEFEVKEGMNFPLSDDWEKAKADLNQSQQDLIKAIENFPDEKLSELVPHASNKYTFYTLLHGIIHHDLYHIGQIMLINKASS